MQTQIQTQVQTQVQTKVQTSSQSQSQVQTQAQTCHACQASRTPGVKLSDRPSAAATATATVSRYRTIILICPTPTPIPTLNPSILHPSIRQHVWTPRQEVPHPCLYVPSRPVPAHFHLSRVPVPVQVYSDPTLHLCLRPASSLQTSSAGIGGIDEVERGHDMRYDQMIQDVLTTTTVRPMAPFYLAGMHTLLPFQPLPRKQLLLVQNK